MKSFIPITVLALFLLSCAQNPPSPNPNPNPPNPGPNNGLPDGWQKFQTSPYVFDIAFASPAKGFVFKANNGISRTLDSGKTWTSIAVPTGIDLRSFNWLNGSNQFGYAVGPKSFAYTKDGGDTWTYKTNSYFGYDIAFCSPARGVLTSDIGLFLTIDTGNTWSSVQSGNFTGITFVDSQQGWATQSGSGIYYTQNGGSTWTKKNSMSNRANTVHFLNENLGWFTVEDNVNFQVMYKTVDKGNNWTTITIPSFLPFDVQFVTDKIGYAAGNGTVYKSTDGGVSWQLELKGTERFYEVFFLNENYGWAQTEDGSIYRFKKP